MADQRSILVFDFGIARTSDSFTSPAAREAPTDLADLQRSFSGILGRARDTQQSPEERAREAAEQLVAQTFIQPMLKELREADRTAAPFAPTRAEKQFRALMDAELAQRLVKAGGYGLVERVARDLLKMSAPAEGAPAGPRPAAGASIEA